MGIQEFSWIFERNFVKRQWLVAAFHWRSANQ